VTVGIVVVLTGHAGIAAKTVGVVSPNRSSSETGSGGGFLGGPAGKRLELPVSCNGGV
jgi:hypothetical protein